MADRSVLDLPRASCDRAHDHFAGVHTDANLNRRAAVGAQALAVAANFFLHPQ